MQKKKKTKRTRKVHATELYRVVIVKEKWKVRKIFLPFFILNLYYLPGLSYFFFLVSYTLSIA